MKKCYCVMSGILFTAAFNLVFSQAITFQSPMPWITLRGNNIVAKALIDTAEVKGRPITVVLTKVEKGKKVKISSKTYKSTDYSNEYDLGTVPSKTLGGKDYLRIEWLIPGTEKKGSKDKKAGADKNASPEKKGSVEPFGIVILGDSLSNKITGKKVASLDIGSVSAALSESEYVTIGNSQFGLVWNEKQFGIVCKNSTTADSVTVCVDPKNGKNAFLSFADRFITYFPQKDSLAAYYFKRKIIADSGLKYDTEKWIQEIKKEKKDNIVLIICPWYDLGMVAAADRTFGFAVFSYKSGTKSFPDKGIKETPGTWANMTLK